MCIINRKYTAANLRWIADAIEKRMDSYDPMAQKEDNQELIDRVLSVCNSLLGVVNTAPAPGEHPFLRAVELDHAAWSHSVGCNSEGDPDGSPGPFTAEDGRVQDVFAMSHFAEWKDNTTAVYFDVHGVKWTEPSSPAQENA